ncbi:MAG: hypothetical protein ACI9BG_000747, partial [Parasphingorhabdus sp.]
MSASSRFSFINLLKADIAGIIKGFKGKRIMKIKTKIRSLPCTISLAVACIATPISSMSLAQTLELEEIIVTAQKRSQNLQEVPLTIASFSAEAIKEYGVTNIQSL